MFVYRSLFCDSPFSVWVIQELAVRVNIQRKDKVLAGESDGETCVKCEGR